MNFGTPISFGNTAKSYGESFIEGVDDYFFTGGRKYQVLSNDRLLEGKDSACLVGLKIASYCTVGIPILMGILKLCARGIYSLYHRFKVIIPQNKLERVCLEEDLNQLVIPQAKLLEVDKPIDLKSVNEQTIEQLAIFIAKTGFSDLDNISIEADGKIVIDSFGETRDAKVGFENLYKRVQDKPDLIRAFFPIALQYGHLPKREQPNAQES